MSTTPIWRNFKTVTEHRQSADMIAGECSKLCYGCKKTWAEIAEGMVHMMAAEGLPCGLQHAYVCDGCVENVEAV